VAVLNVRPITAVHFDFETVGQLTNNLPTTGNGGQDPLVPIAFEVGHRWCRQHARVGFACRQWIGARFRIYRDGVRFLGTGEGFARFGDV
jgi:hypothetical protein